MTSKMCTALAPSPVYPLPTTFTRSIEHQRHAHAVIPGAAHTYAKGDDQYPENMCPVIVRGQGCHVWDLDGNRFIEFGSGVRSVTLGHGYRPVVDAAFRAAAGGTNFVRPHALEMEAADAMLSMIPGADMIKFAKHGSDATTAAVKLARAWTGRDMVVICSDHPFFSVDDWFIGTTDMDAGILDVTKERTVGFRYNDLASLEALFAKYPNRIACVIMEAERDEAPRPGFLQAVRDLTIKHGALLVFDEIVAGFRLHTGGGQALHGITPDLSTWGKAMANGFSIAALAGRRDLMELGGLRQTERDRVFLLSTTNGAETSSLAACVKTIEVYKSRDVIGNIRRTGEQLRDGFNAITRSLGIHEYLYADGHPSLLFYITKDDEHRKSQPFRTLFLQEILKRGILAPSLVANDAFTDRDLEHALWAFSEAAEVYRDALEDGVNEHLVGRSVKPVFRKRV
ncbi:MAG: glutamate-1-semialdehyde 2,1-aminomutase [Tepidisphaeraceae bacterium]